MVARAGATGDNPRAAVFGTAVNQGVAEEDVANAGLDVPAHIQGSVVATGSRLALHGRLMPRRAGIASSTQGPAVLYRFAVRSPELGERSRRRS